MEVTFETLPETVARSGNRLIIAQDAIDNLERRYQLPVRAYHTLDHPKAMLALLNEHQAEAKDPLAIAWAIAYHDAVYDPKAPAGQNEALSAQFGYGDLYTIGRPRLAQAVSRFTLATAAHQADPTDRDLNLFLDIDLAILGASPDRYAQYATDIRTEYSFVNPLTYAEKRTEALRLLSQRIGGVSVFATESFHERYETVAQENIQREIDQLVKASLHE